MNGLCNNKYYEKNIHHSEKKQFIEKNGGEGHRSPYLSHAKRSLYHLSYTPDTFSFENTHFFTTINNKQTKIVE